MDCTRYCTELQNTLIERDASNLTERLTELIEQNHALGNPKHGFLYGGQFHTNLPVNQHRQAEKKLIHPDLQMDAQDYWGDFNLLVKEQKKLYHGLSFILKPCTSPQQVRDMLPTSIARLHPELAQFDRERPAGWAFAAMPLQYHQFEEIVELLEFYASNRLL